jgi:hypothetical protein
MPAKSLSIKLSGNFVSNDRIFVRSAQRYSPQLMFGIHKKFMLHVGVSFSNMHTANFRGESFFIYGKYRFFSADEVHKHFRIAAFVTASHTKAPFHYDELSLMGDKSGIELGLIATQLWNKIAFSGTLSHTQLLDSSRFNKIVYIPKRIYQSINYSLSAGYLLFPKEYTDYKQTNLNLYLEILGQQTLNQSKHFIDLAPAIQIIFNSNTKLNIGYRFQLNSNMQRMTTNSWLVSLERTFLNVLRFRKQK